MSDDFDRLRELRPDRVQPDDPVEPTVFAREKERLMSTIDPTRTEATREGAAAVLKTPDIYPRLAYEDERAALDYLTRVFQLAEIREARTETDESMLAWLRVGDGVVMIGHANAEIHRIHSPRRRQHDGADDGVRARRRRALRARGRRGRRHHDGGAGRVLR